MATKRKKKRAEATAPAAAPRKRKRKAARSRKRRSPIGSTAKRGAKKKPLMLVLRVEDVPINSAALARLSDAQRVDLASINPRKSFAARPAWATDEQLWRKAIRTVGPHWQRLSHPWPTVAWVYLRMDGPVGQARGIALRETERAARGGRKQALSTSHRRPTQSTRSQYGDDELDDAEPVRVERLRVDETGIDEFGTFRGRGGIWWRVWNASMDSVVRAATAAAARAVVTGRAH
jgi:hypothetical protein